MKSTGKQNRKVKKKVKDKSIKEKSLCRKKRKILKIHFGLTTVHCEYDYN